MGWQNQENTHPKNITALFRDPDQACADRDDGDPEDQRRLAQ